jgi:sporulation protein YlmC with PRC-barrel domain
MRKILLTSCAVMAMGGLIASPGSMAQSQTPSTKSQPSTSSTTTPMHSKDGVQRVGGATLKLSFYNANPADFRLSKLMGKDVYNLQNENVGEVSDVIISNGKTIKAIVVDVGGFLGMGERSVALDPGSLVLSEQSDGSARLVVNSTKEDLKKAPAFNVTDIDKTGTQRSTTGSGGSTSTGK